MADARVVAVISTGPTLNPTFASLPAWFLTQMGWNVQYPE